jgi:hypothetical protein
MRQQLKLVRNFGGKLATGAMIAAASVPAFAQEASYDTGPGLLWIAAGVTAGILILGAMLGLVIMIGAGKKTQRAGT